MSNRRIFTQQGQRYIVLPYDGFSKLSIATDPAVPQAAVPLYDTVAQWLGPATELLRQRKALHQQILALAGPAAQALIAQGVKPDAEALRRLRSDPAALVNAAMPAHLFRGESNETSGLMPTLFRFPAGQDPDRLVAIRRRSERRQARLLKWLLFATQGRRLSTNQARAAARHNGVRSSYLDFTFNPRIAARFALPPRQVPARTAIMYGVRFDRLAQVFSLQGMKPNADGGTELSFHVVSGVLHVPYLAFDAATGTAREAAARIFLPAEMQTSRVTISSVHVPGIRRIARQEGAFLDLRSSGHWIVDLCFWYIVDFISDKWCLAGQAEASSDDQFGIGWDGLFPDDGRALAWFERRIAGRNARGT